jgi:transposase-like protein
MAIAQLLAECNQYQLLIRHPRNILMITVNNMHVMIITFCQFEKKITFILDGSNRFSSYRYESCEYQFTREQNSLMILI